MVEELREAVVQSVKLHFKRPGSKSSLYDNLVAVYTQTGRWNPKLNIAPPEALIYLWNYFWELNAGRPVSMGLGGIPHSELLAWLEVRQIELSLWEQDVLRSLDELYIETITALSERKRPNAG